MKKDSFRSGNIIWEHAPDQDQIAYDSRNKPRIIKRYIGRNRGKDYAQLKKLNQGQGVLSFSTGD